jgi:hydroxypyruvate isomerase
VSQERFGYDANLMFLFTDVPLLERPAAAAACGFRAVELWWPFESPSPPDGEVTALAARLHDAGTQLVSCNFYPGDMAGGDRGMISVPGGEHLVRASVETAIGVAELTGCRVFNALYGNRVEGATPEQQDELAVENLSLASAALAPLGVTLVLEALNPAENPAFPLNSSATALAARQRALDAGASNVALLVDLYHFGRIGEAPADVLTRVGQAGAIGHVQIADVPDRHEPGSGSLGVEGLIGSLANAGWDGWVGLEYRPSTTSAASLSWLDPADLDRLPVRASR